jgi:hypothetical protein
MRFDTIPHPCDGGLDLPVDWLDLGILEADGEVRLHNNMPTHPQACRLAVQPCREEVVGCVEGLVTWGLARRPVRGRGASLRARTRALPAGPARGPSPARPPRGPQDRRAAAWRTPPPRLRRPAPEARHP